MIDQHDVTHTKFTCESCGDRYVFVELGDWPVYCPTCGHKNDHGDHDWSVDEITTGTENVQIE